MPNVMIIGATSSASFLFMPKPIAELMIRSTSIQRIVCLVLGRIVSFPTMRRKTITAAMIAIHVTMTASVIRTLKFPMTKYFWTCRIPSLISAPMSPGLNASANLVQNACQNSDNQLPAKSATCNIYRSSPLLLRHFTPKRSKTHQNKRLAVPYLKFLSSKALSWLTRSPCLPPPKLPSKKASTMARATA